jgi:uncharacterized protein YciW
MQHEIDVIDAMLGPEVAAAVAPLRNQKPDNGTQLQRYYDALFDPTDASAAAFSRANRFLVAVRVASHTRSAAVAEWYAGLARAEGVEDDQLERAANVDRAWTDETVLGAAIRHADLVTRAPDQTSADNLDALKEAGISPAGILSLAQTIAFVSYQLRLVAGLRALGGAS